MKIVRHFVDLPHGQMHYASCGDAGAPPVLLLHQTPRSWREYKDVIPLLARRWRVIAVDTPGFGDSEAGDLPPTIDAWADAIDLLLERLALPRVHVVGHHTGGVIAVALAGRPRSRVHGLVLSSTPITNAQLREERRHAPAIDEVPTSDDGSHLMALWGRRAAIYPHHRPDLLQAFVADALKVGYPIEQGHRAVTSFEMESRLPHIDQRLCVFQALEDRFASKYAPRWRELFPRCELSVFADGGVPLPDQFPERFAHAVDEFLGRLSDNSRDDREDIHQERYAAEDAFTCVDGSALDPATSYRLLSSCVVPRPIAWVTTRSEGGTVNAAPFSAYTYVATDPPMVAISIEGGPVKGGLKDTARNIRTTGEFVVNVVDENALEAMHHSAAAYPADVSEAELLDLPLVSSRHVGPPRIGSTAIQMECRLEDVIPLGNGTNVLYIGRVVAFHLADRVYDGSRIDPVALRPVARLGGPWYMSLGDLHERPAVQAQDTRHR